MNTVDYTAKTILFWSAVTLDTKGLLEYHVHSKYENNVITAHKLNVAMDMAEQFNFPIICLN